MRLAETIMTESATDQGFGTLIRTTVQEFRDDECPSMAAALAYYTALAMPPLLVMIVSVAGWMWGPDDVRGQLQNQVTNVVGEGGWTQIETMMQTAEHQEDRGLLATALSLGLLLFSATGVMLQLQTALNKAWGVMPDPAAGGIKSFVLKRLLSLAMILGIAFLLIVSLLLTAALNVVSSRINGLLPSGDEGIIAHVVNVVVNAIVFTALFAAMFKWLPDAVIRWRDTLVGAGITAALFLIGQFGMGVYFGMKEEGTYGVASSFVLLLLWVYYSSMIFLLGAEFTQVWARMRGMEITPEPGAVRVERQTVTGAVE
jgi:membrane protein